MAESNPSMPSGAVPPKPGEAPKPQAKKETVRISLPPKPTATIKLPTLPAAGAQPTPATAAAAAPVAAAAARPAAPAAPTPPSAARPAGASLAGHRPSTPGAAPAAAPATAPTPPRPVVSASGARRVSKLDIGLAVTAAVTSLGAVVSLLLLLNLK